MFSFENDLDPWLTIEQNIKFNAMLYSVKSTDYQQRLKNYTEALNLNPYLNQFAYKVSGGIQKKAMLVDL